VWPAGESHWCWDVPSLIPGSKQNTRREAGWIEAGALGWKHPGSGTSVPVIGVAISYRTSDHRPGIVIHILGLVLVFGGEADRFWLMDSNTHSTDRPPVSPDGLAALAAEVDARPPKS
jgi:hypothetical protein